MSSDHTAIGQALGYAYQFERATYRLLEAENNVVSVGVEHVDDVSVHRTDGTSIREQDKSTIGSAHPVTDRSVALWKTISIWVDAVLADPSVIDTTEFHLVTNGTIALDSLAARIGAIKEDAEAEVMASELLAFAADLRDTLKPFAASVIALPQKELAKLIKRIHVFDNRAAAFGGAVQDLQSLRYLSEFQKLAVFNNAGAWVRRSILETACEGRPTIVDRIAFDREVTALLRRVAAAPLAIVFEPTASEIDPARYESYGFFQQLEWIDTDPDFVRDCVIHYVLAQATRIGWTDADGVSEGSLRAYEDDLKSRWKLQVRREAQKSFLSPVAQGAARLIETLSEDSVLDGQAMPKVITCGNYHALANFTKEASPELGWHPDFVNLAKRTGDAS
jgi:hypothetical protein